VAVETRLARVAIARFANPQPARTIGMIWRKTSPLGPQLMQVAEVVRQSAMMLRGVRAPASAAP